MLRRLLSIAAAFAVAAAAPARAQDNVQAPEEALAQDAGEYARAHNVALAEAERRLRAEAESVAATDAIAEEFADRLAGISIRHQPDFRIVVRLTGDAPVPERTIQAAGLAVPVEFRVGARATRAQALAALARHSQEIRQRMPGAEGIGYDPRTGELVVMLDESDMEGRDEADVRRRIEEGIGVPVRLRILGRPEVRDFGVEGGSRVEGPEPDSGRRLFCTTGFIVSDGRRSGIITAAHCPDTLTYYAPDGTQTPLEFVGQWGAQFQDVQVNVGEVGDRPLFYADPRRQRARALTGQRRRAATRAGETVCHRGEASGYSCAEVDLTDYAPPGDLCGGPCHPVWTTVTGPGCRGGDSGGPVFVGTTAFGILKGGNYMSDGRCNFYYYMSTDYLPPGWSLVVDRGAATRDAAATASRTGSPDPPSP